jgi:L-seryl-tRNA(Ser) seleniumtransferase
VVGLIRRVLDEKHSLISSELDECAATKVATEVATRARAEWSLRPHKVINATGTILHTGIGRAPLSPSAVESVTRVASYCDLEYELGTGRRGSRHDHVEPLLTLLLGCEATMVVVNNAAAILLALAGLAAKREVLISRGQTVEIGGGFRVPEILRQSSARLIEVGTTNRTSLADYEEAIGPRTAAVLHVHTSNFRVIGFTRSPQLAELAALTHARGLVLISDNGSGAMIDTAKFGLAHEPTPAEAIAAGADIVTFSGDKLLGGPQTGVVAGREKLMERLRHHQLARAVRPDKVALAALQATLVQYAMGRERTIPTVAMLSEDPEAVLTRARRVANLMASKGVKVEILAGESAIGGGSLPGQTLPSWLLLVSGVGSPSRLATTLRQGASPVIARVARSGVLLDIRTVMPCEELELVAAVVSAVVSGDLPANE